MERVYFSINEAGAKTANDMMSFSEYKTGSKTAGYKAQVDKAYELAEKVIEARPTEEERVSKLCERYSRRLAQNINKDIQIGMMCPSVMISGAGNFPVKKKEKQALTPAQEAERQNKRNKKQIKAILKEAANTRKAFIEGILSGRIKKVTNEEKVVAELFEQMMSWETFTGHNTLKEFFLGDKCYNAQKEDIEAAEKKMEGLSVLYKLLCMVSAMVADADLVEWNYTYNTVRGKRVKAFYGILEQYGFQFPNDEEKSVVEGTSDLYVKKEC